MIGLSPSSDESNSDEVSFDSIENNDVLSWMNYVPAKITPIPDPKNFATMARFIVHNASK